MIGRFLELVPEVSNIILSQADAPAMLSGNELDQLKEIKRLLHPLEQMTKEISGQNFLTVSNNNGQEIVHELGRKLKMEFLKEFNKRFDGIEKSLLPAISIVLDPRCKILHFKDPIAISTTIRFIKSEIAQNESFSSSESEAAMSEDDSFDLWAYHKKIAHTKRKSSSPIVGTDEVTQYLGVPVRQLKEDPLELWEEMKGIYLNLYKLSLKHFCILATSVPSEILFSKAGLTATKNRSRLTSKLLSKLLFLSSLSEHLRLF
ncbi:unnamed protein product [Acanthoscelides obtectus]|uniref:HAT C-terminal dimerisation domain-containing protein n=1 Tax=Acanthoscelides obtectus TaxID=200917 RepID=A0A9P0PFU2_ACAOB|nr:unnamed protein product [Acanthoscelides obtectus]CAK1650476.1 hypothetical protein AOBTE_LOCUS16785 [Acanthoscelides obtectus]